MIRPFKKSLLTLAALGGAGCVACLVIGALVFEGDAWHNAAIRTQLKRVVSSTLYGNTVRLPRVNAKAVVPAKGPLRVSSVNRRYFTDGSGRAIILTGDHTWYTLQDGGRSNPPEAFDFSRYLDFLQANRINFFRMFIWEQAKGSVGITSDWWIDPLPFVRTGAAPAADGRPAFDLSRFDDRFFARLRERVVQAGQRGIYVSIQLFEGFSVQKKPFMASNNPWPWHPFAHGNNVNGIDGDFHGNGQGEETETLESPVILRLQHAYLAKVIDTVSDLDNVLFEVCNEAHAASTAWQEQVIRFVHDYERSRPKQHPVGRTVSWPGGTNEDLFRSQAEWISPNSDGGYYSDPPAANGSKVIVSDTDHLCYPCGDRTWAWKTFLRGMNPAFMDPYDCKAEWAPGNCNPNDATWVSLRQNLGHIADWSRRLDLAYFQPRSDLASSGYCLARTDRGNAEYLVYLPSGGAVEVNLTAARGPLSLEWFDTVTGVTKYGDSLEAHSSHSFQSPFPKDSILYLHQRNDADSGTRPHGSPLVKGVHL